MPSSIIQRSFAGGEIGPELAGRADQAKFQTGLARCRNWIVRRSGGITTRPGTNFIAQSYASANGGYDSRIMDFRASSTANYVLELGQNTMRIAKLGALVTVPAVAWVIGATYDQGDTVLYSGVYYYSKAAGNVGQQPNIQPTWWFPMGASGALVIPSPWASADLRTLQAAQSADVMTFAHPLYPVYEVRRYSDTKWQISLAAFAPKIAAPTPCTVTPAGGGANSYRYRVTAVSAATKEESLTSNESPKAITGATQANPCVITCVAHGYTSGDEATFAGVLGMTQLNGITTTLTVLTVNTFRLDLIDSTAFTAYTSAGTASRTYTRIDAAATPSTATPNVITWPAVSGAVSYNVYRELNGVFGFIGLAVGTTFNDINYGPVTTDVPPSANNPFATAGNYPSCVQYAQQRLLFANSVNAPEGFNASKTGKYNNFTTSVPTQSDDAISWTMAGRQVAPIRHILEIGRILVLTDSSEWTINGDGNGVLTPTSINATQQGFVGASYVPPVIIQNNAIFVQARGSAVRDLAYDFGSNGYIGRDLTIYAPHLFDGYTLISMSYAQIPQSVVWAVRSDGVLLGLTYIREQEVWGWHWHDTDGLFKDVVCIPEGSEDAIYVLVRRTIGGVSKDYLERFASRKVTNVAIDAHFVDAGIIYDGRNTTATTLTISGGVAWLLTEALTLTASAGLFSPADVGLVKVLTGTDGQVLPFTITGYTSPTVVTGNPGRTVPASLRAIAATSWTAAASVITGLAHLEGKTVAVCADGNGLPTSTVTGGQITLDRAYSVVHVGLVYLPQAQLLNYEQTQAETLLDKVRVVARVSVLLQDTIGLFAGTDTMRELKPDAPANYNTPLPLMNGTKDIPIDGKWSRSAQVTFEQRAPLPASILTAIPRGQIGGTP